MKITLKSLTDVLSNPSVSTGHITGWVKDVIGSARDENCEVKIFKEELKLALIRDNARVTININPYEEGVKPVFRFCWVYASDVVPEGEIIQQDALVDIHDAFITDDPAELAECIWVFLFDC